jgi:predicted SAM-dependent methyltransferase
LRKLALFLFTHRFLAIARWELHFLALRLGNFLTGQGRRARTLLASRQAPVLLNLGAGPRGRDDGHWLNIDGFKDHNVHLLLDLGRRLPFPDGAFAGVFCEHVVEHFTLEEGQRLAAEVARVLQPGGRFRVIVPDAEHILRQYFEQPRDLVARRGEDGTPMQTVNSYFRQRYEHQFLYDWPTMEAMLRAAGFASVERRQFGEGDPALVLDDEKYAWESLYVEAVKA